LGGGGAVGSAELVVWGAKPPGPLTPHCRLLICPHAPKCSPPGDSLLKILYAWPVYRVCGCVPAAWRAGHCVEAVAGVPGRG
jgi:hypothetical protein